ncbi:MAG: gluconate 2-dehydrogenase subunit 3 family protein [Bryobacteraceae bacterium]|nr:gluconate 2-dehydrogenase subunit 3 family protein [Bryobacteraceae bacterium]MDW8378494.1 gluconate 2-dehydrogenase subunit 3 family protein [Bryobacterales bacterium]
MKRRELFPILGAGIAWGQPSQTPRFFTAEQYRTVVAVADTLLPDDGDIPGAVRAGAPWFIDTTLFYVPTARQAWLEGLEAVDGEAQREYGKKFAELSEAERIAVMERFSQREDQPQTAGEHFFVLARRQVLEAWLLSEAGQRQGLRYRGNTAVEEFPPAD